MQHLWSLGLEWDQIPPSDVCVHWNNFKFELPLLSNFQLPRMLFPSNFDVCELHGYSDASEKGYAAVIYFRTQYNNVYQTFFVIAKSKVAPLKRISIPRIELCAAVLLSDLICFVQNTFQNKINFFQNLCLDRLYNNTYLDKIFSSQMEILCQ